MHSQAARHTDTRATALARHTRARAHAHTVYKREGRLRRFTAHRAVNDDSNLDALQLGAHVP